MSIHYSTAGQAIADYRARTNNMTQSSQHYYCAVCHQSRQIVGRKLIAGPGRKRYVCAVCVKAREAGE